MQVGDSVKRVFSEIAQTRTQFFTDLGNSRFVVSPPGNGIDCHRTWEALALGAIPIVQNSSLWGLYEDERILVVRDVKEVCESGGDSVR